ncbi:hypothetical protein BBM1114_00215 [Bifidobacterium breve MCC 1114]|uniref:Uncharacterized protein n=1 Tax=Bifidobacterium breve MCC 1114 TaxID=1365964 RepID=A0A0L7D4Y4_BIFBR|nr:hypothetical protein BBM0121_03190 [Bifidobacterium breve MCC 0121]KOA52306.1 hypothetical protein BBM1340_02120 [Bifidobacterium breve MCC 1340]KOA66936.1 hypothetical protein BBM1114_00215 [Bifidobacterium breve MCC 1114]
MVWTQRNSKLSWIVTTVMILMQSTKSDMFALIMLLL